MSKIGKLFFISGEYAGNEVPLSPNSKMMLGRASNCQLIFKSERVSRLHCTIMFNSNTGKLMVVNHSEQGILVDNSQNVQKEKTIYLSNGSQMKLGHSNEIIQFICEEEKAVEDKSRSSRSSKGGKISIEPAPDDNVFNGCFVDANEKTVAVLENSMLLRCFTGGRLSKNKAVLSNKRFYYNQRRGLISDISTRACINVEDITGTEIVRRNPLIIPIIGIILLILDIIVAASVSSSSLSLFVDTGSIALSAFLTGLLDLIVFCWIYICIKGNYLVIRHAGGCVRFKVVTYSTQEILNFQKAIYALKDSHTDNTR